MPAVKPLFEVRFFQGINNQAPANKLIPVGDKSFLASGTNIDIDNHGMPHLRGGFSAASYPGAGIHSLWGNGETCLFVEGQDLKLLNADFTATTIRAGVGESRMAYAESARRVYYTNSRALGYVQERAGHAFPAPVMTYKIPMPAGHLIEWYNGRLYVAREKEIWASDPMYPGQTDSRKGFKQFAGRITLMRAIRNTGIYVSDSFKTYLLAGLDMNEFALVPKADFPAILGTDVKVEGSYIGQDGLSGEAALWLSPIGLCVGGEGGVFKCLTEFHYRPLSTGEGAAIVKQINDGVQYLTTQAN
jgi:hypothetical protein